MKIKLVLRLYLASFISLFGNIVSAQTAFSDGSKYPFRDMALPLEVRVKDLISRLTLEEKVLLLKHQSPAIPRLGIPAYNWWNEALHGVARTSEKVTVFPQAIAMAATFNTKAIQKMGDITASEGRALFNEDLKSGKTGGDYRGLTYWTPNINIFRDPRWGRGQETYGEDPYLTAQMGMAIVKGLEGNHPHYLKSVACVKHFAVHSGPEHNRHSFNANPSDFDLWDTYLPAFRTIITKGKVHGVMCAYNRLYGNPCCGSSKLLQEILRNQWKFEGYVVSDCWAVSDFMQYHKTHTDDLTAAVDALRAGTDLECGNLYQLLQEGVQKGLLSERDINVSLERTFTILFRLGMFDLQEKVPYASIGREVIECKEHKQHAYKMAQESIVLMKNENHLLPLKASKIKRIALIGPNANNEKTQLANYFGTPSEIITPYESLLKRFADKIQIDYFPATGIVDYLKEDFSFSQIVSKARKADVIVFVGGISADYEGEAGDAGAGGYFGFASGDRTTMALPKVQTELLKALKKTGRPIVLVNMSGSVMHFEWENQNIDAILQAWYGGQAAGDAIVDVLFGDYNPAGRMPLTTYKSDADLPSFEDYSMSDRTYRYFKGEVLYPFGHGLSYTKFTYTPLRLKSVAPTGTSLEISVTVTNKGKRTGDEVMQLYVTHLQNDWYSVPICALKGFQRITLEAGESKEVVFTLSPEELALTDVQGNLIQKAGKVKIFVGGGQPKYAIGSEAQLQITGNDYQIF